MTIDEAKKMIKAKLECMERDVSGKDDDCNNQRCYECPLNYEQGNMGEQKEWLRMSIKALEFMEELMKLQIHFFNDDNNIVGCLLTEDVLKLLSNRLERSEHDNEKKDIFCT